MISSNEPSNVSSASQYTIIYASPFIDRVTLQYAHVLMQIMCAKALTRGTGSDGGGGERSTISQIEMVPGAPFFRGV